MQETNKEKISSQEKIVDLIEKEMEHRFKNLSAKILAKKIDSLWIKQKKVFENENFSLISKIACIWQTPSLCL